MNQSPQRNFLGFNKLPARAAAWVMPLILSILMTCIVSLVSTLRSQGLAPGFFSIWMSSWGLSWVIGFPTLLLLLPVVRKATGALVNSA
jgi:hypothetical protein